MKIYVKGIVYNPYKNELLFIRRNEDLKWEVPGGKLETHDHVEMSLLKRIKEDIGIAVEIESLEYAKLCGDLSKPTHLVLMYICTTPSEGITLSLDHSEYRWKDLDEILSWEYLEDYYKEEFIKYDIVERLNNIFIKVHEEE
ncbi:MAG: NUDIX hydrolase [Acholeplasmatales bacterium]|nr:NUDIX hydrolase [Acholeplasmatales bacterium]